MSACSTYKHGMKTIGFSLEDEDAREVDHNDFMRVVIAKIGPRCFFCNLEVHFKCDCPQYWETFRMLLQGSRIQSKISVAGHQVIRNLSEPSEFTMMHRNLSEPSEFTMMHSDTYADHLRQVETRTESRAVRALLTMGGPRTKKLHRRYVEVYGPYQVMLNVDGISIYTRTYVTTDGDQKG